MKVLALDYGAARTGVAVSDATGTIARPLGVVRRAASADGLSEIAALVREHEVECVLVGLPLTLRGERGARALETVAAADARSRAAAYGKPDICPMCTTRSLADTSAGRQSCSGM